MKKLLLIVLVVGILFTGAALFCLFRPEKVFHYFGPFETTLFTVRSDIKKEYTDFEFSLDFMSKLPFRFFVEKMHYTVSFDSTQFSQGTKNFNRYFRKGDHDTISLPLRMEMDPLKKKINSFDPGDSTTLYIDLVAYVKLPVKGMVDVHMDLNKRIPAPQPPQVEINSVTIDKFTFKDMQLLLNMDIINPNSISLIVKDAQLGIDFPELFEGEFRFPDSIKIKANSRTSLEAVIITNELELVKDGLEILFNNKQWNYVLTGKMKIASPKLPQNEIKLVVHNEGKTHLMKRRLEQTQR